MFNNNVGHYFIKYVAIYSNFCINCNVHGFYNMLYEVVSLIVGGVPKVYHTKLCQKLFGNQQKQE